MGAVSRADAGDDGPVSGPPVLMILRGNSASGKSTVARRVQRSRPQGEVAVIGQDAVRRDMLWAPNAPGGDTAGLLTTMVRHCLGIGRTTILEGILGADVYRDALVDLLDGHPGPHRVYYLDVGLPETLRRHAGKPIAPEVSEDEVASWYREHDVLGVPGEVVLGEERSEDALVAHLLADLEQARRP